MVASQSAGSGKKLADAREYGRHLAEMLAASHFTAEQKDAWAFLLPEMTAEQLIKFDALLQADMSVQATHGLDDLIVAVRAAQHRRDLSISALNEETSRTLDEIEKEIEAAG